MEEKQLYVYFKREKSEISQENLDIAGNFYIETESLLTQNNAIRIKYVKAKIAKTQQNGRCRLWIYREGTANHISENSEIEQKEYKTRKDWVDKVIHPELCKK